MSGGSAESGGWRSPERVARLVAWAEAQGADQRLHAGTDGRIADAELPLHVTQVAAAAEEALEHQGLLAGQAGEAADPELPLDDGPAVAAAEAGDIELARADRAGGDDVMRHGVPRQVAMCLSLF